MPTLAVLEPPQTPCPGECADCAIGATSLYAPTWTRAPERLCALRQGVQRFGPHQLMIRQGEPVDYVSTLRQGWAARIVQFPDGRRQILSFLLPGDTIASESICLADYKAPYSVRALTSVVVCSFRPKELHNLLFASAPQREHFAGYVLEQRAFAERRLTDVGRRSAQSRLAHLLCELFAAMRARGLADGLEADFPPRQEDLADALGLTKAHVNRTLVTMRRRGLVTIRGGRLAIHDLAALQAAAAAS